VSFVRANKDNAGGSVFKLEKAFCVKRQSEEAKKGFTPGLPDFY
jgi:hypothetical protein